LKEILQIFEEHYGPYRWDRVGYVLVNFSGGAMEHAMNIAYPQFAVNGNLTYQIPVPEGDHSELDDIARNINQISEAVNVTVQNELKNQRMKAELISNVSHDLKTPLTSMVTYIDLLKQEGLSSPRAGEYLDVLDNKTNRLRQLTEDLFEAAKAASGAMPVRLEKVELISLINQGLGELNEGINESGFEFILNNHKEKYYVWAAGQLMWRVMENILGNVLKYAQPDTRVYMDVREEVGGEGTDPDMVIFEVKNISRQSLNIDAEELMERFKRGDEARSSDGSGLGLSIAKDLVKLQKGVFEVKIDGDLFKSIVVLNRYPESEGSKEEDSPKPPTETLQEES
jgi:signal transduction histidine kinase